MDIIDRHETVKKCKSCGGEGFTLQESKNPVQSKTPGRLIHTMETVECICRRNERVERKFPNLHPNVVPSLSEAKVAQVVKHFKLDKGLSKKNYVFFGNPPKFFRIVKATFVYLIQDASARFFLGTGMEVIKNYYVGEDDRNDFMALLRSFDLVILLFDSKIVNKALQPVMVDLIQTRQRKGLSTWVWSQGDITKAQEWSEGLSTILNDPEQFVHVNLNDVTGTDDQINKSMGKAKMRGGEQDA